ncbi:MAG TPA: hypothetical protein VNT03_07185 [Baekduia sp.]|nr:hypothetical protein [Baekduia sp.]
MAAAAALAVPALSSARSAPLTVPASPQTLTLDAYESPAVATWQKKTWRKSRNYCKHRVDGVPRWRLVIKSGKCGTVVKSAPLAAGQLYSVKVSGLISHWRGAWKKTCGAPIPAHDDVRGEDFNASADAQWTFASKKGSFWCGLLAPHLPTVGAGFRVNTKADAAPRGWKYPWMGQPKQYVKSDHSYSFTVVGTGTPVWFSLYDHYVTDNYGHFTIALTPVVAPPPA